MKLLYKVTFYALTTTFLWNCDGGSSNSNLALLALSSIAQPGIQFSAVVGDSQATCGTDITGHGSAHSSSVLTSSSTVTIQHVAEVMPIGLKDLRFYVSEFELVDQDDNVTTITIPDTGIWQSKGVALIDFENKQGECSGTTATNNFVQADVANKTYKTIRFTLGVPENVNHLDPSTLQSPLNISGLHWDWSFGYIFFKGEFVSNDSTALGNTAILHIGSTGCTGSPGSYTCTNLNRPSIELTPVNGFNPFTQKIQFDFKAAVSGWDISGGSIACHSMGSDCSTVFPNFGLDYSTGGASSTTQSVFAVVSK